MKRRILTTLIPSVLALLVFAGTQQSAKATDWSVTVGGGHHPRTSAYFGPALPLRHAYHHAHHAFHARYYRPPFVRYAPVVRYAPGVSVRTYHGPRVHHGYPYLVHH